MLGMLTLGMQVNTARFENDLGRANHIAQQQARKIARTLGGVAAALGGAVSVAAFTKFTKDALNAMDAAEKFGQKVGVATKDVAGLQLAADQSGVGINALQSSLVRLTRNASDAAQGIGTGARAFDILGVSVIDAGGALRSTTDVLYDSAQALSEYEDGAQKTALATQLFGRAGADLLPLLNGGADGMRRYAEMADQMGLSIDKNAAQAAERFNDALAQMGMVSKGVFNQIATALAPALADLAESSARFFQSDKWRETLETIRRYAGMVADNLGLIVKGLVLFGQMAALNIAAKAGGALISYAMALVAAGAVEAKEGAARVTWWNRTTASINASRKSIGLFGIATNLAMSALAGWKIGDHLREEFAEVEKMGIALVAGSLKWWETIKHGAQMAWRHIGNWFAEMADGISTKFAQVLIDIAQSIQSFAPETAAALAGKAGDMARSAIASQAGRDSGIAEMKQEYRDAIDAIDDFAVEAFIAVDAKHAAKSAAKETGDQVDVLRKSFGALGDDAGGSAKGVGDATKALEEYAKAGADLADALVDQRSTLGGMDAAYAAYVRHVIRAQREAERFAKAGRSVGEVQRYMAGEMEIARRELAKTTDELKEQGDVVGRLMRQYEDDTALVQMTDRQHAIALAVKRATEEWEANAKSGVANAQSLGAVREAAARAAGGLHDVTEQIRLQQVEADRLRGIWGDLTRGMDDAFGSFIESGLSDWDSFGRQLVQTSKKFMADIAKEFAQGGIAGGQNALQSGSGGGWGGAVALAYGGWQASKEGDTWGTIASYTASGATIGSIIPVIGTAVGAIIGAVVGVIVSIVNKAKTDAVRIVGGDSSERGERNVFNTALGTTQLGSRGLPQDDIVDAITDFDQTIYDIVNAFGGAGDRLRSITETLNNWVYEARGAGVSGEDILRARFEAIMETFDEAINAFVAEADDLEDQVQRLLDALSIEAAIDTAGFDMAFIEFARIVEDTVMIGEQLADAAQRIAGGFMLFDSALRTMGISLDRSEEEAVRFAAAMTEAAGGLDRTQQLFATFFDAFYFSAELLGDEADLMRGIVADAMAEIGMSADTGMQEFRAAFEDALPTMSPDDVVLWLQVAEALNAATVAQEAYLDALEAMAQGAREYVGIVAGLRAELHGGDGLTAAFAEISQWAANTEAALHASARAAGRQAAAEGDLALVHQVAARRAQQAIAALEASSRSLVDQLYGASSAAHEMGRSVGSMSQSFADASRAAADALNLMIGDYSDYSDADKLELALEGLKDGIVSPEQVLAIGRRLYASGADYNELFEEVLAITGDAQDVSDPAAYYAPIVSSIDRSAELSKIDRFMLADQLAHNIASLAMAQEQTFADIADRLGLNLGSLASDLGIDSSALDDYLHSLAADEMTFSQLQEMVGSSVDSVIEAISQYEDPSVAIDYQTERQEHHAEMTITTLEAIREEIGRMSGSVAEGVEVQRETARGLRDTAIIGERERRR